MKTQPKLNQRTIIFVIVCTLVILAIIGFAIAEKSKKYQDTPIIVLLSLAVFVIIFIAIVMKLFGLQKKFSNQSKKLGLVEELTPLECWGSSKMWKQTLDEEGEKETLWKSVSMSQSARGIFNDYFVRAGITYYTGEDNTTSSATNLTIAVMRKEKAKEYEELVSRLKDLDKLEERTKNDYDDKRQQIIDEWWKSISQIEAVEDVGTKKILSNKELVEVTQKYSDLRKQVEEAIQIAKGKLKKA